MINTYNYLSDTEFLLKLDKLINRTLYAKIILLTWEETPIEQIEGKITTGSISVDGKSALQRSCSLTMPVPFDFRLNAYEEHLNKKINIEIGIKNDIDSKYPSIIWFPQGIYILTSFSSSINNNSYNISIQAKDKMCMLNGDIGGSLTANYTFDSKQDFVVVEDPIEDDLSMYFIQNEDGGFDSAKTFKESTVYYTYETEVKYTIKEIIKNIVHEIGKEPYHNIFINDIDDYGMDLVVYKGEEPIYFAKNLTNDKDLIPLLYVGTFDDKITFRKNIVKNSSSPFKNIINVINFLITIINNNITPVIDQLKTIQKFIEFLQEQNYYDSSLSNILKATKKIIDNYIPILNKYKTNYNNFINIYNQYESMSVLNYQNQAFYLQKLNTDLSEFQYLMLRNEEMISSMTEKITSDISVAEKNFQPFMRNSGSYIGTIQISNDTVIETVNDEKYILVSNEKYIKFSSLDSSNIIKQEAELIEYKITNTIPAYVYIKEFTIDQAEEIQKNIINEFIKDTGILYWAKNYQASLKKETNEQKYNYLQEFINILEELINYLVYNPTSIIALIQKDLDAVPTISIPNKPINYDYLNNLLSIDTSKLTTFKYNEQEYSLVKIAQDDILGYRLSELIYPGKSGCLSGNIGSSVTSILDKIKQTLGDYEYFYDLQGHFIFQKTKAYVNNDWTQIISYNENNPQEIFTLPNAYSSSVFYTFNDLNLITQLSQTPAINSLKNDFAIQGKYKNPAGITKLLDLRIAIDEKPQIYVKPSKNNFISTPDPNNKTICFLSETVKNFNIEKFLGTTYSSRGDKLIYNNENIEIKIVDWRELIFQMQEDYFNYHHLDNFLSTIGAYNPIFYPQGYTQYEQYYTDIQGFWREIYNPEIPDGFDDDGWNNLLRTNPSLISFWFDFLDSDSLKKYSVRSLGDRQATLSKDQITAIYYPENPNILIGTREDLKKYKYSNVYYNMILDEDIFNNDLYVSSSRLDAFTELDGLLYKNLYCSESLNITCVPIFYLVPNTRIYVYNPILKLNGNYLLSKMTIPLSYNGTMQLTTTKLYSDTFTH